MRKILFFPVILALCVVNFASFGATRASRGSGATPTAAPATAKAPAANVQTTAARAASVRNGIKTAVNPGVTSARSATQTPTAAPKTARSATNTQKVTTARAGSTKKVISTGTKVEVAKENTLVDQECQDAYYGCMDAFCMLDNASGGRCQCSDRNAELDNVLEEILKLDEQSYALATEGVERLQMGDNADVVMARAKAAADKVTKETLESKETAKKKRTLDLSAWNTNLFSDDEEDNDIFGDSLTTMESKFADKKGDDLHTAAAKLCTKQLPEQCQSSGGILQLTYASKVRSDCSAYENSLKQQRNSSQQKLLTAQKALRDTALEMYENENKYDLGQCVIQYKQCMQTTAECGTDFSGCIADTAILQALYNSSKGGKGGVPTTAVKTGTTTITISSATYDILNNKKLMCESVTKQCINANKNDAVWKTVLREIMPAVYTAEYSAASNSRMNCISTIVSCVQKTCGSQWDETSDNYDACLSDPDLVIKNTCTLEAARCGDVGSSDRVMAYVRAKLAAIRVDKCTQEVKECLLSEDRCGPDYSGCIGLDTDTIVDLCVAGDSSGKGIGSVADKLIACQTKYDSSTVRDYVAQVAQGLALNIDNSFAQTCQNAADAAFARVCGAELDDDDDSSTDSCPNLIVSDFDLKSPLKWEYCKKDSTDCHSDLSFFENDDIKNGNIIPEITGKLTSLGKIQFNSNGECGISTTANSQNAKPSVESDKYFCLADGSGDNPEIIEELLTLMDRDYSSLISRIESDSTVTKCRDGRSFQKISRSEEDKGGVIQSSGRYTNLLNNIEVEISDKVMTSVLARYYDELKTLKLSGQGEEMAQAISKRRMQIIINEFLLKIMQGKTNMCDLTEPEFANLMSNEELQTVLKNEQDKVNLEECEGNPNKDYTGSGYRGDQFIEGNATRYREDPNFCSKPRGVCSDNTWQCSCKNGNAGTRTQRKTPSYDPTTNTCVVKIEYFNCKTTGSLRKWRDRCKQWNTGTPDSTETKTYTMPEWNDKGSTFFKEDCPKDDNNNS